MSSTMLYLAALQLISQYFTKLQNYSLGMSQSMTGKLQSFSTRLWLTSYHTSVFRINNWLVIVA